MSNKTHYFTCSGCGEAKPTIDLSRTSLAEAGTPSRVEALEILDDPLCGDCETEDLELLELFEDAGHLGRSTLESWELSGVQLDPGQRVFLEMNY